MYLNTNIAAMNSQRNLYQTNLSMDKTLERLSSGLKISSAADDASGLAMVEKMAAQKQGTSTAIQNTQDGIALYKIAEGALNQVGKMLSRIEELTVRASNKTLTSSDRITIKNEIDELMGQINTISGDTEYNTIKLLNGNMDVQKYLVSNTNNKSIDSISVLNAPATVQNVTGAVFSLVTIGETALNIGAALASGAGASAGFNTTISLNGVEILISNSDNVESILSKINNQNSKTGVMAVMSQSRIVSLISGKIDSDAANVNSSLSAASGSIIGYAIVGSFNTITGTANKITIGGSGAIWSNLMGFTNYSAAVNGLLASGINASAKIDGIDMAVKSYEGGNIFEMQSTGSKAYGIKIGVDLYNGAFGGYVINNSNLAASAFLAINGTVRLASAGDGGTISLSADKKLTLQTGANYGQNLSYNISLVNSSNIGKGASSKFRSLEDISVATSSDAVFSLKVVQQSIRDISDIRATIGAVLNRLEYTDKTLQLQNENLALAESKIRDADISAEMTTFTKQQILMQAGTSMLAQANHKPQTILYLLR